jgi:multidrug efflux pump subunit AcrA (membrane-fusion protein)
VKVRYHESFLFPQGQEDFGGSLVFPQGQLHGLSGLSGVESLQVIGSVTGRRYYSFDTPSLVDFKIVTPESARAVLQPTFIDFQTGELRDLSGWGIDDLENNLWQLFPGSRGNADKTYLVKGSSLEREFSAQKARDDRDLAEAAARRKAAADQEAAQQAAAQQAAAQQAAAQQAAAQQAAAQQAAAQQAAAQQAAAAAAAQQAAAQQAAAAQIQATSQAAAKTAAAAAKPEVSMATSYSVISFDDARSLLSRMGKYTQGMTAPQMSAILTADQGGNPVKIETYYGYKDAESILRSINSWVEGMSVDQIRAKLTAWNAGNPVIVNDPNQTAAAVAATTTQTTATNTATGTVQTTDKVTGATSTANIVTGLVRVQLPDGTFATGMGEVKAGGVTTTVDPKTGVVTTQNTQTGVATQTDPKTGKTVTATQVTGTSTTGGTFVLPDGKTVTTNQPITSTAAPGDLDLGKIALFGLLGLLLLRGAVR